MNLDSDTIDLCEDEKWVADEWIGRGKTYPTTNVPLVILQAREALLTIPEHYATLLPNADLPVNQLLRLKLPSIAGDIITCKAATAFAFVPPTGSLSWLMYRSIPPMRFVENLEDSLGQRWFDGAQSIIDQRMKGNEPLPFWILTWWRKVSAIIEAKGRWRRVDEWLGNGLGGRYASRPDSVRVFDEARALLGTLGWNARVTCLGASTTTLEFSRLPSNEWLNDHIMDIMVHELACRMRSVPEIARTVMVQPLPFATTIQDAARQKDFTALLLSGTASLVRDSGRKRLYFILHHGQNHWVAFLVNFETQSISHGDSMGKFAIEPRDFLRALQAWLAVEFGRKFTELGNVLPHGVQQDTYNCGVCAINTIAHALFGDELWTQKESRLSRVEAFTMIVNYHQEEAMCRNSLSDCWANDASVISDETDIRMEETIQPSHSPRDAGVWSAGDELAVGGCASDIKTTPRSKEEGEELAMTVVGVSIKMTGPGLGKRTSCTPPGSPVCKRARLSPERSEKSSSGSQNELEDEDMINLLGSEACEIGEDDNDRTNIWAHDATSTTVEGNSSGPTGISKSARHARELRLAYIQGTHEVNEVKVQAWKQKILDTDIHVEFDDEDLLTARHSDCGKWVRVDTLYDVTKWRKHLKSCTGKGQASGMSTIETFLTKNTCGRMEPARRLVGLCPGITAEIEPKVTTYLQRTGSHGGGAESITIWASRLFGKKYKSLTGEQKDTVKDHQERSRMWQNEPNRQRVLATKCEQKVTFLEGRTPRMCQPCRSVQVSKKFQNALRLPLPAPENYKFLNNEYRNESLGEIYAKAEGLQEFLESADGTESLPARFAKAALRGEFDHKPVFMGMVEAMTIQSERAQRGVGLQNMKYDPAFDEFAHILAITSPSAYRIFRQHFQARTKGSFRKQQATQPRFPIGLTEQTFVIVEEYLQSLDYNGPLALSCDDTKLFPTLRMFFDGSKKTWYLVGGIGNPLPVADADELDKVITSGQVQKATKLRLWCLQIPLPNIPPLVLAGKAIPGDLKAPQLFEDLLYVLEGLWERNVAVVSYSCDGTETERRIQRMLVERAHSVLRHVIPHPRGIEDIVINIPTFHGHPIVVIQDSKHGLKTFRNNLFSGARLLILGDHTATYSLMRAVAFTDGSPLYHRDVEKLDRQDDHAATRLFSAASLSHLVLHHPRESGQIIYLFIFGELIDAYQNRSMPHIERVKIALRTKFFLQLWRQYLRDASYPHNRYYISRECDDIAEILINGILSLIVTYRDHITHQAGPTPLLPWLHSTETCEHVFAELRKLVKDFSYLDFLYAVPKLRVLLKAVLLQHASNPKSRAQGYSHTWFDSKGIDFVALATYPSDDEINSAAVQAYDAAESLFSFLDVAPPMLQSDTSPTPVVRLPGIDTLLHPDNPHLTEDSQFESHSDAESEADESEAAYLQRLIDIEDRGELRPAAVANRLHELTFASVSATVDDTMRIHGLPDPNEEHIAQDCSSIQEAFKSLSHLHLPYLDISDERCFASDFGSTALGNKDYSILISLREAHQTVQAAHGMRAQVHKPSSESPNLRRHIISEFESVLGQQQGRGVGTGLDRKVRWKESPAMQSSSRILTGNAANADQVANTHATQTLTRRNQTFRRHKAPLLTFLTNAGVSPVSHLKPGDYGFVLHEQMLMVGRVISMYSRGGGKHGAHMWVPATDNLSRLSYLALQVYEHTFRGQFRAVPQHLGTLFAVQYVHLPAQSFLCRLSELPTFLGGPKGTMELGPSSFDHFNTLRANIVALRTAVKSLNTVRRKESPEELATEGEHIE